MRKQIRRLKTPTGILLSLVGLTAIGLWGVSIALDGFGYTRRELRGAVTPEFARVIGSLIGAMSLIGALSFRGLYLPREEIELLFAAPISRADVIRYRLWTALGKSLFGATFFALVVMGRVPTPLFGFLGAFLAMMTLPVVAQIVSLFAGDAENRWLGRLPKGALRIVNVVGLMAILALLFLPTRSKSSSFDASSFADNLASVLNHPLLTTLTLPAWPWAQAVTAKSAADFALPFVVCLLIWWLLFQLCVRVRIDYRELSLETSADVARRLSRARRGAAGASAGTAHRDTAGWRVPWLFGRSPFGALAWRKTGTILRKARGTMMISGGLVLLLVITSMFIFSDGSQTSVLASSVMIACAGTIYLCAGLRFDFREDLDRMDVVRSWPVAPWKVFLATLLPEVVLVFALLAGAILVRSAIAGVFPPLVWAVFGALLPCVWSWVAIDNAVFLVWPVRMTPGQEGLLQQAGRSLMLMLLRLIATALVGGTCAAVVALCWLGRERLDYSDTAAAVLATVLGITVLVAESLALVFVGGKLLSRFDVARDR
jgi:hypothetical protein